MVLKKKGIIGADYGSKQYCRIFRKAEIDKIDVDKLKTVPVDLSKLSNAVNNDVVNCV